MRENNKVVKATYWSFATQLIAKIIPPISNMILARLFAPEVFGIIATITMVTNFADTVSESGFQKYIISKNYSKKKELFLDANVAFWTNLGISIVLWGLISLFSTSICILLGNSGLEMPLIIACIQLPLTSLSSIQTAVYHRDYNFKRPFIAQLISSIVTLFVTVFMAFRGRGFWSIIFGNIIGFVVRAVILSFKANWRPHFYYSLKRVKSIFSFSIWIMIEAIAVWLTSWFDSFIIGKRMNEYNLGIYKNSQSVVNGLVSIPQNGIVNVLIVTLSKNVESKEYNRIFLNAQKMLAYILVPLGVGIFVYRELVVRIVFGSGWEKAELVIALWSLASIFRVLLVSMNTAVYISKGKPKVSFYLQLLDIFILIPACIFGVQFDLERFVVIRCIIRLDIVIPSLLIMTWMFKIKIREICGNLVKPIFFSSVMGFVGFITKKLYPTFLWQFVSIGICILIYSILFVFFAKEDFKKMIDYIKKQLKG